MLSYYNLFAPANKNNQKNLFLVQIGYIPVASYTGTGNDAAYAPGPLVT
jgi:hypothetical protein